MFSDEKKNYYFILLVNIPIRTAKERSSNRKKNYFKKILEHPKKKIKTEKIREQVTKYPSHKFY